MGRFWVSEDFRRGEIFGVGILNFLGCREILGAGRFSARRDFGRRDISGVGRFSAWEDFVGCCSTCSSTCSGSAFFGRF